jgi:hypothetical protein
MSRSHMRIAGKPESCSRPQIVDDVARPTHCLAQRQTVTITELMCGEREYVDQT